MVKTQIIEGLHEGVINITLPVYSWQVAILDLRQTLHRISVALEGGGAQFAAHGLRRNPCRRTLASTTEMPKWACSCSEDLVYTGPQSVRLGLFC